MSQYTKPGPQADDHLAALDSSLKVFLDAAENYPRDAVKKKPSPKAFSATEIVYHMLDVEHLWQKRMRGLVEQTMTHFQQMDPDKVAIESNYNEKSYDNGILELKKAREETHKLVRSMMPRELEYVGIHSKYGEMDTFRILETIEEHDHTHAAQLQRTLQQVGAQFAQR
jgi:uncharacterized damage-inducible protein DinB